VWQCAKHHDSPPPPPDPNVVAAAQSKANKEAAAYSNVIGHGNTTTPLGSQIYTPRVDPTTGATVYDANITLAPGQQQLLDQQNQQNLALGNVAQGMLGQVGSSYNSPVSQSSYPQLQGSLDYSKLPELLGANDLQGAAKNVSDAIYNQQATYLDPQYQQSDTAMRTRLANQGITQGSEAWNNAIDAFNRDKMSNYQSARNAATTGGIGALDTLGRLSLADRAQLAAELGNAGQFRNQASNQGLQQTLALRNQPLNEFNALRSASPVSMPQFNSAQNQMVNPTDISSNVWNAYQGRLNNYNQQQASGNNFLSGLFGLGAAAIPLFSDERLKTDIEPVGTVGDGLGVYNFRYKDSPKKYTGLMAQEVEQVYPEDIVETESGYKAVDVASVLAKQVLRHGR
jgi:hypothetical protein